VHGTGFVAVLHLTGAIRAIFKHLRANGSCSLVIREGLALFDLSACRTQFYTHERLQRPRSHDEFFNRITEFRRNDKRAGRRAPPKLACRLR
jgi:hypothetical protein